MGLFFRFLRTAAETLKNFVSKMLGSFAGARVLAVRDGKMLAIDQGAYLELPGGQVEFGESFSEAAMRELEEETGLSPMNLEILDERELGSHAEVIFQASVAGTSLNGSWEGEPVWVSTDRVVENSWRYDRDIEKLLEKSRF